MDKTVIVRDLRIGASIIRHERGEKILYYEKRKRIIWNEIIGLHKMQSLFNAPRHLKSDSMKEGRAAYLEALFDSVNSQLSGDMSEEDFTYYCKQISKDMIQSTTIRTWYMPNDLRKCALKHGQIWIGKQAHLASYENPTKQKKEIKRNKDNPESMGWTLESIAQHKENLRQAVDNNELKGTLAQSFRQILDSAESKILARQETPY